jgi:hypothetical protein
MVPIEFFFSLSNPNAKSPALLPGFHYAEGLSDENE